MKRLDDKKRAVYELIQKHGTSLGTRELLSFLPGFAERSVRRWLRELCEAQLIEKAGKKRSTKYRQTTFLPNEMHNIGHCLTKESIRVRTIDVLRVRYRKQRRQLLTEIILHKKIGTSVDRFIKKEAAKLVPKNDLPFFIEDVKEDLVEIDSSRIYGLGVTMEEFRAWEKIYKQRF